MSADLHQTYIIDTSASEANVRQLDATVLKAAADVEASGKKAASGMDEIGRAAAEASKRLDKSFEAVEKTFEDFEKAEAKAAAALVRDQERAAKVARAIHAQQAAESAREVLEIAKMVRQREIADAKAVAAARVAAEKEAAAAAKAAAAEAQKAAQARAKAAVEARKQQDAQAKAFLTQDVDRFSSALGRVSGALAQVGAIATAAIGGISFAKAIQDALEFEQVSSRIIARGGGLSADSVKGLVGGLGSASELAAGLEEVQKLGHQGAEAMDLLALGAKAAKSEGADLASTLRVIDDSLDAYNLGAEHAQDVTDLIAKGAHQAGEGFDTFGAALTKVLPLASELGISFQEADAALATMIEHGVKSDRASAALSTFLGTVSKQGKELTAAGIDVEKILGESGLQGLVKALAGASGDSAAALEKLGVSSRTLGPIMTLLSDDTKNIQANLEGLSGAAGTVEEGFGRISKTLAFQFDEFKNSVGLALIEIGQGFLGEFIPNLDAASASVKEMIAAGDFKEWGKNIAEAFRTVGEALKPLIDAFEGFVDQLRQASNDDSITAVEAIGASFESMGVVAGAAIIGVQRAIVNLGLAATVTAEAISYATGGVAISSLEKLRKELLEADQDLIEQYRKLSNPAVTFNTGKLPVKEQLETERKIIAAIGERSAAERAAAEAEKKRLAAAKERADAVAKAAKEAASELASFQKSVGLASQSDIDKQIAAVNVTLAELSSRGVTDADLLDKVAQKIIGIGEAAKASNLDLGAFGATVDKALLDHALKIAREPIQPLALPKTAAERDPASYIGKLNTSFQEMEKKAKEAFEHSQAAAEEFRATVGSMVQDVITGSVSVGRALGALGHDLLGGLLGGTKGAGGGLIGQLLGKLDPTKGIGKFFAGGGLGNVLGKAGSGLAGLLGGSATGLLSGALTGGLGLAVSAVAPKVIGAISGLFRGAPEWKKVSRDVQHELGVALSEGTAQAIADTKKQIGVSRSVAELIGLDKIIGEADLSKGGAFDSFAKKALESLQLIKSGGAGAKEAAAGLEGVYGTLITKADELGLTGTEAFAALLKGAKASGVEIKSLGEYFAGSAKAAAGAFSTLLENSRIDGAGTLDSLGALGKNVVDSLRQTGASTRQIVDQLGPGLDALVAKQEQQKKKGFGQELSPELGSLVDFRNFAKENADTFAAIDSMVSLTHELGRAGFFTAEGFAAAQKQVVALDTQLLDARDNGLRSADDQRFAITQLAPALQEIINEHVRNGKAIDAETQKLIDQGVEYGILNDKGTDLASNLHTEFDRLISALEIGFGKKFPDAVAKGAKEAAGSIAQLSEAARNATPKQIAEWEARTGRQWPGSGPQSDPGTPPGPAHADGGYTGSRGGTVGPNEYVFSSPAVNASGPAILDALHQALKAGRGAAAGAGRVINVILEVNGRRQLLQTIEDAIDSGDIRIKLSGAGVVR